MPQLKLASYSVGVSITETSDISHIAVRRLSFKRREDQEEERDSDEVEGAEIMMSPTDPGKVTITYNPDVRRLQTELRSEKHPLQLIVEYEVNIIITIITIINIMIIRWTGLGQARSSCSRVILSTSRPRRI